MSIYNCVFIFKKTKNKIMKIFGSILCFEIIFLYNKTKLWFKFEMKYTDLLVLGRCVNNLRNLNN